jgi:hypothetical protein
MGHLFHEFWFIQLIGAVALAFQFLAWGAVTRKKILCLQSVNLVILGIHFALLYAYVGALMNIVAFIRNLVLIRNDGKPWRSRWIWFGFFAALSLFVLVFSWQGYRSMLPVAAVIISMYALWDTRPAHMRFYMLIACFVWIPYTVIAGSYSGLVSQLVGISGILWGMYRYDRKVA